MISNKLHADAASTKGSDKSMMVSWPDANRGGAEILCRLVRRLINVSNRDIRCFRPATCAGLKSLALFSNSHSKPSIVKFSPNSRRIDYDGQQSIAAIPDTVSKVTYQNDLDVKRRRIGRSDGHHGQKCRCVQLVLVEKQRLNCHILSQWGIHPFHRIERRPGNVNANGRRLDICQSGYTDPGCFIGTRRCSSFSKVEDKAAQRLHEGADLRTARYQHTLEKN